MKFTYNGMEVECTVEEFMKIAGGSGEYLEPAKEPKDICLTLDPVELDKEVIDKLTDPASLTLDPVELDKETINKLIFGEDKDENFNPCATCELCSKHSSLTCEDTDGNTCPNYSHTGCAHENGVYEKYKESNALVDEFKKDPRYLDKEEPWPYDEAVRTFESIVNAGFLLSAVDIIVRKTDDPGYEPGGVVIICPEVDGAYQVYDDAGYVMPVDDLVGFVRRAYHADINIYSPFEVIDNDFAQEIEDACTIVAAEEVKKLLKQR